MCKCNATLKEEKREAKLLSLSDSDSRKEKEVHHIFLKPMGIGYVNWPITHIKDLQIEFLPPNAELLGNVAKREMISKGQVVDDSTLS